MKIKLLLLISILAFSSCKKDNPKIEENSKFVKVWFDTVRSYPFKAKLVIKKDKTFEYRGGACTSRFGAKGIWKIENDTIILNSIKPKECMWKHDFGLICEKLTDRVTKSVLYLPNKVLYGSYDLSKFHTQYKLNEINRMMCTVFPQKQDLIKIIFNNSILL